MFWNVFSQQPNSGVELGNNPDKNNIKLKFAPVAGDSVRIDQKKSPIDMSLGTTSFVQSNNGGYGSGDQNFDTSKTSNIIYRWIANFMLINILIRTIVSKSIF